MAHTVEWLCPLDAMHNAPIKAHHKVVVHNRSLVAHTVLITVTVRTRTNSPFQTYQGSLWRDAHKI
jgi:hypothetical protein